MNTTVKERIKSDVLIRIEKYKQVSNYDFWEEHIKYVVKHGLELAEKYSADKEIVELGALLHDIALIDNVGSRAEHHINGADIAVRLMEQYMYPKDKIEQVKKCVLNHRNSQSSESIEETCVADADILAHFSNIPMQCANIFGREKLSLHEGKKSLREGFIKEFNELSPNTQKDFKFRFELIMNVVFGEGQTEITGSCLFNQK